MNNKNLIGYCSLSSILSYPSLYPTGSSGNIYFTLTRSL